MKPLSNVIGEVRCRPKRDLARKAVLWVKQGRDSRGYVVWGTILFLIIFHSANNIIVLHKDTVPFQADPGLVYAYAVRFLRQFPDAGPIEKIRLFYRESHQVYPPLLGAVSALFMAFVGRSQDAALLGNLPFFALLIVCTYLLGKHFFSWETGLIAAVLVSFFPGIVSHSRAYLPDFALAAMVALSMLMLVLSDQLHSRKHSLLFGIAVGLTALTKPSFSVFLLAPFLLVVVVPLFLAMRAKDASSLRIVGANLLLAGAAACLIALPWYVLHTKAYIDEQWYFNRDVVRLAPGTDIFASFLRTNPVRILGLLIYQPLAWLFVAALTHYARRGNHRGVLLSWFLIPPLFFYGVRPFDEFHLLRYLPPLLPAVALILGWALLRAVGWEKRSASPFRLFLLVVLIIGAELPLYMYMVYGTSSDLRNHFTKDISRHRYSNIDYLGRLSPTDAGFAYEEILDLLERQWGREHADVFLFNPYQSVTGALVTELEARSLEGHVSFEMHDCAHLNKGETQRALREMEECIALLERSGYIFLEPFAFEWMNEEEIAFFQGLNLRIKGSLDDYVVLMTFTTQLEPSYKAEESNPAYAWLNRSIWILKRKFPSANGGEGSPCAGVEGSLERDVCYWDETLESWNGADVTKAGTTCYYISDPNLQYVCLRLQIRPHMMRFLRETTAESSLDSLSVDASCLSYRGYHRRFCSDLLAARLSGSKSPQEAAALCAKMGDERLKGECQFYAALPLVFKIENGTTDKITSLMGVCEDISHPQWRSECYYLIADELALLDAVTYAKEISRACEESTMAEDFRCFHHVPRLIDAAAAEQLCLTMTGTYGKSECYLALGQDLAAEHVGEMQDAIEGCDRLLAEGRPACFNGLGLAIGERAMLRSVDNVTWGIETCALFPEEFRQDCFSSFGWMVGELSVSLIEFDKGLTRCDQPVKSFRESCFTSLGREVGFTYWRNTSIALELCTRLPAGYVMNCKEQVGRTVGRNFYQNDVAAGIERCMEFPSDITSNCFDGLSEAIGIRYAGDRRGGVGECERFPDRFRQPCIETIHWQGTNGTESVSG